MKHFCLFWSLVLLIFLCTACNLNRKTDVRIESITISPKSAVAGSTFNATVKLSAHNDNSDTIQCFVTTSHDPLNVYQHDIATPDISLSFTFPYSDYFPGTKYLYCETESGSSRSERIPFTVTSGSDSGQPGGQPAGGSFTNATLTYFPPPINTTTGGNAGPPLWCFTGDVTGGTPIPPLTVALDGSLKGDCAGGFTLYSKTYTYGGTTTGQWNTQTGLVDWTMDMWIKIVDTSSGHTTNRTLQIKGSDPVITSPDGSVSAKGTASWKDTCQADNSDVGYIPCDTTTSYNWSGTLNWQMTFNP